MIPTDQVFHSPDLCSVTLAGNLVSEPKIRYQANPVLAIADITIATHSRWYDKATKGYKEWTNYHNVKVVGDIVEQQLIHAQKGQVVLIQGHLSLQKATATRTSKELLLASFVQVFSKGYSQEINQLHCSGKLIAPFTLKTTENNKIFAEATLSITQQTISAHNQQKHIFTLERPVQVWGKQAQYLSDKANIGDQLIIEGKLNYLNNAEKSQFIDGKQIILSATKKP
jgi:single-strand DNA-binding protein